MKNILCIAVSLFTFWSFAEANPKSVGRVHDTGLPKNFIKVSDSIYRGARPSQIDLAGLAAMGIKNEISLQGGDIINPRYRYIVLMLEPGEQQLAISAEAKWAASFDMNFSNVPLDSLDPISANEDLAINNLLITLTRATAQSPVFIHCEHGRDRTGLVIALYRVSHDHWNAQAAYNEWVASGHGEISQLTSDDLDTYFWQKAKNL